MKNLKLKSKIPVSWNNTNNTNKTSIMEARILELYKPFEKEGFWIVYEYVDVDGEIYDKDRLFFKDVDIDALYIVIKSDLGNIDVDGKTSVQMNEYYQALRHKMAERFDELSLSDIEIV